MSQLANLALEGGDPRNNEHPILGQGNVALETQLVRNSHDKSVTFEEYMYYASVTRAEEKLENERYVASQGPKTWKSFFKNRFSNYKPPTQDAIEPTAASETDSTNEKRGEAGDDEKKVVKPEGNNGNDLMDMRVSAGEWKQASRAIRTASWSSIFFLITTDILGPFSTPWAFAQMGYGPGVALYTVFGGFALYSGWQLYKVFLTLDSDKYPMKTYADCFFRVYGSWARHIVNILQAIQLILSVSVLILGNGQAISQISQARLCFVVCLIVFMAAGFLVGQIRTLQRFGWLANFSVWINVLIIFICMGVAANSPPNLQAIQASFSGFPTDNPVTVYAGTPPSGAATGGTGFTASLNGLNQAIYSFGGAMLFISFMSEMRNPWDFWKALIVADVFIYVCYMFFGIFVYSYQGQYAYNPVMQGLSPFGWQVATNAMNLVSGLIAACLYGNIGVKVLYVEVGQEFFKFPPLTTKAGKYLWVALIPIYWAIAFLICAAIPAFSQVSGLVGAVCILQFTYTFPAILAFGFQIKKDAMTSEEVFDPVTGQYSFVDRGFKRWARGFMVKWHLNTFNFIYFLGALATAALGIYSEVESLITAFSGGNQATSFGCGSPTG